MIIIIFRPKIYISSLSKIKLTLNHDETFPVILAGSKLSGTLNLTSSVEVDYHMTDNFRPSFAAFSKIREGKNVVLLRKKQKLDTELCRKIEESDKSVSRG